MCPSRDLLERDKTSRVPQDFLTAFSWDMVSEVYSHMFRPHKCIYHIYKHIDCLKSSESPNNTQTRDNKIILRRYLKTIEMCTLKVMDGAMLDSVPYEEFGEGSVFLLELWDQEDLIRFSAL